MAAEPATCRVAIVNIWPALNHYVTILTPIKQLSSPGSFPPEVNQAVKTTKAVAAMLGQKDSAQHDFLKSCP